jgi:beta-lactamase superfamily II metal-dependent hydrolase
MSIVKSLSVGHGDMFYIHHGSDNFTIIDCCMPDDIRTDILGELRTMSHGKTIQRFISTHPDQDHVRGLTDLHDAFNFANFYCVRNEATKSDGPTVDFTTYCTLRDDAKKAFYVSAGCTRKWMNQESPERGSSGINVLWPKMTNLDYLRALQDAKEGHCPNNISTVLTYQLTGGTKFMWLGDLETQFMEDIEKDIKLSRAQIVFAPHHGRDSGRIPQSWLEKINPDLIIVGEAPSEHLHYYPNNYTLTQNSTGDITFECVDGLTHIYVADTDYSVDFLWDYNRKDNVYGNYIGTLKAV